MKVFEFLLNGCKAPIERAVRDLEHADTEPDVQAAALAEAARAPALGRIPKGICDVRNHGQAMSALALRPPARRG